MIKSLLKVFNKFERWTYSKKGQRFFFINDIIHSVLVFGIMIPTGILSWLWEKNGTGLVVILVVSGLYSLYNAQRYYTGNYRY